MSGGVPIGYRQADGSIASTPDANYGKTQAEINAANKAKVSAERKALGQKTNALNSANTLRMQINNGVSNTGANINALIRSGYTPKEAGYLSKYNDSYNTLNLINTQKAGVSEGKSKSQVNKLVKDKVSAQISNMTGKKLEKEESTATPGVLGKRNNGMSHEEFLQKQNEERQKDADLGLFTDLFTKDGKLQKPRRTTKDDYVDYYKNKLEILSNGNIGGKERIGTGFFDRFGANFSIGFISQEKNNAANDYMDNPTEDNRKYLEELTKLEQEAMEKNVVPLSAEGDVFSKDLAQWIPQGLNVMKNTAVPTLAGVATGNPLAAKASVVYGQTVASYQTMRGSAFSNLTSMGYDEDVAKNAATDEATLSALIEGGETAVDLFAGVGKGAMELLGGKAAKTVTKEVSTSIIKTILAEAGKYGLNIGSEGIEEALQEVVSIANEMRLKEGKGNGGIEELAEYCIKAIPTVFNGENTERIKESAHGGAKLGAVLGGATLGGTHVINGINTISSNRQATQQTQSPITDTAVQQDIQAKAQQQAEQTVQQTAPQTETQTVEQTTPIAETTVAPEVSNTPMLDSLIATGRGTNALAEDIINNPTAYAEFESTRPEGEKLVSKAEKRKAIKEYINSKKAETVTTTTQTTETVQPTQTVQPTETVQTEVEPVQTVEQTPTVDTTEKTAAPKKNIFERVKESLANKNKKVEAKSNEVFFDETGITSDGINLDNLNIEDTDIYKQVSNSNIKTENGTTDIGNGYVVKMSIKKGVASASIYKDGAVISSFKYKLPLAELGQKDYLIDTYVANEIIKHENGSTTNTNNSTVGKTTTENPLVTPTQTETVAETPAVENTQNTVAETTQEETQQITPKTEQNATEVVKPQENPTQTQTEQKTQQSATTYVQKGTLISDAEIENPVGVKVVAGDRGNVGTIVTDHGNGTYTVRFISKDGLTAIKQFNGNQLRLASNYGSKKGGRSTTAKTTTKVEDTSGANVTLADLEGAKETLAEMPTLPPQEKEAGNSRNIRTNARMPEGFRAEVEKNPDMYQAAHNKETLDKAISIVEENGVAGAVSILQKQLADAKNGMKMPLESAPLSKILINELYKDGSEISKEIARQIKTDIGAELTYSGQFAQANVILRDADPLTRLETFQKYIDKINKTIENNFNKRYTYRAELTENEINRINSTDFGDSAEAMENMRDEIITRVGREMPATLWQVLLSVSKTGMLSLPATHAGNFLANVPTAGLRKTNNLFAGAGQRLATEFTKLTGDEIPKQVDGMWTAKVNGKEYSSESQAKVRLWAKAEKYGRTRAAIYYKDSMNVAKEIYSEIKDELGAGSNKWETGNAVLREQTIIKGGLFNKTFREWGQKNADKFNAMMTSKFGKNVPKADASITQTAMNFISWAMEAEDQPFVKAAFVNSLASYCEARGITSAKDVTPEAIAHATADAMYYTYKNASTISQVFQTLKRGGTRNGKVDVLSDAVGVATEVKAPFVNTLTNIGLMAVEHNPAVATAKVIGEAIAGAGSQQIIDTVSKGLSGGLVIALGAHLRAMGTLSGAEEEDKNKKAWMNATGQKANALFGKLDISQFQPVSQLLSFGANLYDNYVNNKNNESFGQLVVDALWDSADGVLDMEMLQNMSELFGSNDDYKDEGKAQAFFNSFIADLPGRAIPNVWKGVQNSEDMTNRYYKYGETTTEQLVNAFKYVSGWGRETLPENVNVKGTSNKGNALLNTFDSMLYPGQIAQGELNAEDRYLLKLEDEIGDKSMYPQKFKAGETYKNAAGEEIEVGYDDVGQFQKTYSKVYYDALGKMRKSTEFNNLPATSKKKVVSTLESLAKDVAKAEAFKKNGVEYTSDYQKIIEGDDEKDLPALGIDGAISYYMYKDGFDDAVKNKDYAAINKDVARFEKMDKDIKTVLFAKDDDLRGLVNANDYGIKSKAYYMYKDELKPASKRYSNSTTSSVTKLSALANSGISNEDISSIIANNVFDLSSTSLAAVEILTQAPYNMPLNEVADFLYETDYTKNKKYENNDIIDLGKKSVSQTTRTLAKDIENGTLENTEENMEMLLGALKMEAANVNGIEGGTANGTLSNLEMANALSTSENPILKNNANAIYNAFKKKLSNYFNDWGNYSYQSEVNYLPKSKANKGYEYGRKVNALTQSTK